MHKLVTRHILRFVVALRGKNGPELVPVEQGRQQGVERDYCQVK